MDARGLRKEIGKWPIEELLERVLGELAKSQAQVRRLEAENERLRKRLAQYEPEVAAEATAPPEAEGHGAKFSVEAEEKRRGKKPKRKRSPGRRPSRLKFEMAHTIALSTVPPCALIFLCGSSFSLFLSSVTFQAVNVAATITKRMATKALSCGLGLTTIIPNRPGYYATTLGRQGSANYCADVPTCWRI